ncbi:MAG TPA: class I SAM-dependent methyltransferase [Rhodanobacteraceae bacterium]
MLAKPRVDPHGQWVDNPAMPEPAKYTSRSRRAVGTIESGSERALLAVALALIGRRERLTAAEVAACSGVAASPDAESVAELRAVILAGGDPLGDALMHLRSADARRVSGATYTPGPIVTSMVAWARREGVPARVVDPGTGSGRFLIAAGRAFPTARLVAIEPDPVATILLRANLATLGMLDRTTILTCDYRQAKLPAELGRTLFIGNPPYVRHHQIGPDDKAWFARAAAAFGVRASKLAGLHVHFFLRTAQLARPGDVGVFITSSEWLDVNYGVTLRQLLAAPLGGVALHVLDPRALPFPGTATTGAITCFRVGQRPATLRVREVRSLHALDALSAGRAVPWSTVARSSHWSAIVRPTKTAAGSVELGEIFRVHRGQVTGANDIWVAGKEAAELPPGVLIPTVTKARELIAAGDCLTDAGALRRVVNLPDDLAELPVDSQRAVARFLRWARANGADQSYIASHRHAWWAVGLKPPAPILCTYMARRAPAFVRNTCGARHINVAHGLYPRQPMRPAILDAYASWLRRHVTTAGGRTYAGGLVKFEPKELERVRVPALDEILA